MTGATGRPRAHLDLALAAAKRDEVLRAPHCAPLVALADMIADDRGQRPGDVPYPDPTFGGTSARALLLLEAPSAKAMRGDGSGLLSLDNADETAERCHRAYAAAGLDRAHTLHWNAVPWWPTNGETPSASERWEAQPYLMLLLEALPDLRVVVLMGRCAQNAWMDCDAAELPDVMVLGAPHTGRLGMNTPNAPQRLAGALRRVVAIVA